VASTRGYTDSTKGFAAINEYAGKEVTDVNEIADTAVFLIADVLAAAYSTGANIEYLGTKAFHEGALIDTSRVTVHEFETSAGALASKDSVPDRDVLSVPSEIAVAIKVADEVYAFDQAHAGLSFTPLDNQHWSEVQMPDGSTKDYTPSGTVAYSVVWPVMIPTTVVIPPGPIEPPTYAPWMPPYFGPADEGAVADVPIQRPGAQSPP
jgi:hypothetical protein